MLGTADLVEEITAGSDKIVKVSDDLLRVKKFNTRNVNLIHKDKNNL